MRVIAGSARGRALRGPTDESLRPTSDKVKGALFSVLEALALKRGFERQVDDEREVFAAAQAWPRVLDLYAGSGALGIEALSRGAEHVDFVESAASARRLIEQNLRLTGLAVRSTIHPLSAERAASTLDGRYDLILADPPYANSNAQSVLEAFAQSPRVGEESALVWEHQTGLLPPPRFGVLVLRQTRRHGSTALSLYLGEPGRLEGAKP